MNDTRTYAKQIKLNCDENVSSWGIVNTGYSVALVLYISYLMLQLVSGLEQSREDKNGSLNIHLFHHLYSVSVLNFSRV